MRIACIAVLDGEVMDLRPRPPLVTASQNQHGRCMVHHVALRTGAESEVNLASKPDKIGESIVFSV
jgi:hypothetical protein